MNLLNQQVQHKSFGMGYVIEQVDSYIKVSFEQGNKRFVYPDAFGKFLILVDKEAAKRVENLKQKEKQRRQKEEQRIAQRLAFEHEKRQRRLQRERLMKNHKLHPAAQVAFWLDEEEQDQVFTEWKIFTGVAKSGVNKGKPNRLPRVHQNSACIITAREPTVAEETRRIVGVFMVDEGFIGRMCEDGHIPAHPKYRLRLSEEESEQLLFWNYYINERYPRNMTWNSGRHRYFDNVWLAQVLQDILRLKSNPDELELVEEFLEYFCHLNHLDGELAEASGVLVQLKKNG